KADGLKFLAELEHAIFADVERIVVEEKFFGLREHLMRLLKLPRNALYRASTPRVTRKRLRPKAERAERRTSARCIKRNEGMQQKRHVVIFDREVFLVRIGGKRKRVKLGCLEQRARIVVNDLAVLHITGVANLGERLAFRIFDDGVVKFAPNDKIDIRAGEKALRGFDLHMGSNEPDFQIRFALFHCARHAKIAMETD